jgi:polyphosphate kinase
MEMALESSNQDIDQDDLTSDSPKAVLALDNPDNYFNRETSLLDFNERVLIQAHDKRIPLLERLFFLTISSANLDEFFEIRVAGLKQQIALGVSNPRPDKASPTEALNLVSAKAHKLVEAQYRCLNDEIIPDLKAAGVRLHNLDNASPALQSWARDYFLSNVLPVLTPVGLDPAHPFPRVQNKSLNFIVELDGTDAFGRSNPYALVQAPRALPRLIEVPRTVFQASKGRDFILLTGVMKANITDLFEGMTVVRCHPFRVTRNSDLWINEDEADDLLSAVAGELSNRHYGDAVRLEVGIDSTPEINDFLLQHFELTKLDLYKADGPVNLNRLEQLRDLVDAPALRYPSFAPACPLNLAEHSIFEATTAESILLHHPYQAFSPVLEFLRQSARDTNVLAIKMTLYRTQPDSELVVTLLEAARSGKEVTVVIELRARFDEATNIDLATKLQDAGVNVSYGVVGYKTHAKILLVVRREGSDLKRYGHLGTGNYHPGTARAYTDIGLLTDDPVLCEDIHKVFLQLTGLGQAASLERLLSSPFTLNRRLAEMIQFESNEAKAGRPGRIIVKANSLSEPAMIRNLYRASQDGVKIDLIIRGICCLRPGVPGLSENITVRSIIGRFLEHSRVFYFFAAGEEKLYCSSADWMSRNLYRRVEVAFPLENPNHRQRILEEALHKPLRDNSEAWVLQPDGTYVQCTPEGQQEKRSQIELLHELSERGPSE